MPVDPKLFAAAQEKAARVYEAAESVDDMPLKQTRKSHKKCAPGEFGMNKEGADPSARMMGVGGKDVPAPYEAYEYAHDGDPDRHAKNMLTRYRRDFDDSKYGPRRAAADHRAAGQFAAFAPPAVRALGTVAGAPRLAGGAALAAQGAGALGQYAAANQYDAKSRYSDNLRRNYNDLAESVPASAIVGENPAYIPPSAQQPMAKKFPLSGAVNNIGDAVGRSMNTMADNLAKKYPAPDSSPYNFNLQKFYNQIPKQPPRRPFVDDAGPMTKTQSARQLRGSEKKEASDWKPFDYSKVGPGGLISTRTLPKSDGTGGASHWKASPGVSAKPALKTMPPQLKRPPLVPVAAGKAASALEFGASVKQALDPALGMAGLGGAGGALAGGLSGLLAPGTYEDEDGNVKRRSRFGSALRRALLGGAAGAGLGGAYGLYDRGSSGKVLDYLKNLVQKQPDTKGEIRLLPNNYGNELAPESQERYGPLNPKAPLIMGDDRMKRPGVGATMGDKLPDTTLPSLGSSNVTTKSPLADLFGSKPIGRATHTPTDEKLDQIRSNKARAAVSLNPYARPVDPLTGETARPLGLDRAGQGETFPGPNDVNPLSGL